MVVVIIVTHNGVEYIKRCLDSVCDTEVEGQVLVIDNASTDSTVEMIEKGYPSVRCIRLEENIGFGKANNIGIIEALNEGADYVMLLNQDACIQDGALKKLIEVSANNKSFGVISPLHLNGKGSALDYKFAAYIAKPGSRELVSELYTREFTKEIYEVQFVNAAAWLIPKRTLEVVGGFNPVFFHYGEDDNYVSRLHYHGFKLGVAPAAVVFHDREKRDLSGEDKIRMAKTSLLVSVCSPHSLLSHGKRKWSIIKSIVKDLLLLRFRNIVRVISEYRVYRNARRLVWRTSMRALTPGRTYLK